MWKVAWLKMYGTKRGIIGLIVATQHGCNTAATSDIWTPLNVLKGVGIIDLGFPTDSQETLNSSHVKCIKLSGSLGLPNFPRNKESKENVSSLGGRGQWQKQTPRVTLFCIFLFPGDAQMRQRKICLRLEGVHPPKRIHDLALGDAHTHKST